MSPGPAPFPITVSPAQQAVLTTLRRRSSCPQALALRVQIILAAAAGQRNEPLARQVGCTPNTARKWRCRWAAAAPHHPAAFADQVETICTAYAYAPMLEALGCHIASSDEMAGLQALERAAPTKPLRPGCPERREHEYLRHGTLSLIATFNVATGQVLAPALGPTRTEAAFAAHIAQVLDTDPDAPRLFLADNLNTHQTAAPFKWTCKGRPLCC